MSVQVTMNNTMCLGLFLLVVHSRGLNWDFTSEVIVTVGELPVALTLLCHLVLHFAFQTST
jgi:hypothetical protein